MEHYERLLDQAQEAVPEGEDPRRLRPGEIDPTPEAKPARPDPIDMDEDEKEMLAEARARLANTQGKKAKRKARERQLDDSRRLATLQKRRELKAAGVESKLGGSTKRKYIDYTKEIPFQKVPPAGFYTVDDENRESKRLAQDKASRVQELAKLEGRHEREEEEREREKDKRRLKSLFKVNAAQVIAKVSEQNDPTSLRRRLPLSLPAPQVSDSELEDIVKVSQSALMLPPASLAPGSRVGMSSQSLIGDYSSSFRSAPTPLRTPQQENMILQEAHNLRILRDMAPMSGDDVAELKEGTGFGGINPRNARLATPNTVLGTPMRGGESVTATPMTMISGVGAGTQSVSGVGSRRGISSTPQVMRDALGLNQQEYESDNFSVSDVGSVFSSRVPDRLREREVKRVLTQQLSQLPEPEYTYEIALPSVEDGEDGDAQVSGSLQIEDAADAEERQARAVRTQLALLESRKSSVLKRELPRPVPADFVSKGASADAESEALNMVLEETARLIRHDAAMYPFEGVSCSSVDAEELHSIPDQFLANARAEIAKELDTQSNALDLEAFNVAWEEAHRSVVYLPQREVFGVPGSKSEVTIYLKYLQLIYHSLTHIFVYLIICIEYRCWKLWPRSSQLSALAVKKRPSGQAS